ncbi:micrococcal nuclease [Desulfovibrio legallii]|uniref:Micrococcal nuclease n=2 Tax=Desulfovibrio legallii TaxID=571438 RepID=A0A1G7JP89_9BACT|nr:micrococcal nuclease [Desulfovibrio legallii]
MPCVFPSPRRPGLYRGGQRCAALAAALLWAWLCMLALPVGSMAASEALPRPQATVARCFDGDTLKLTDRRVVRLAGIDAPELHAPQGDKAQYYAREARKALTERVRGRKVTLRAAGVKHKDPHGRWLAEVLLEDGESLNEALVREGAAFFYPHRDLSPQLQERLRAAQREAIAAKRGLWAQLLSQPVAQATYLGNKESLRFFPTDCAAVQHIKPRNRVYFGNLMDAFMAGYAPARVCPFWPLVP